jgi:hypothetical protein
MRPAGKGREGHEFFIGTVIAYVEHCFSLPKVEYTVMICN